MHWLGMHDPDVIDPPDRPFSYFANPNDVLGAYGAPVASEVTPEGYVFTGCGELMFFVGNPPQATWQRHRTLLDGMLPLVEYDLTHRDIRHDFRLFAADLGGVLTGVPVNFVRVTLTNTAAEPRTAFFATGWRFNGPTNTAYTSLGDYRFGQKFANLAPELLAGQNVFNAQAKSEFVRDGFLRDGRLVYCCAPDDPALRPFLRSLALNDNGLRMRRYFSGEIEGDPDPALRFDPHSPLGIIMYAVPLAPGESRRLDYKFPVVPLPEGSAEAELLRAVDSVDHEQRTVRFWRESIADRPPLRFPEAKVQEYLVANTISHLLTIDRVGADTIVNVNKFQYHDWYGGGNTADITRSLEYMGLLDNAREFFLFMNRMQFPDGSFRVQHHQQTLYYEMWGYNLWGWAKHYALTRDEDFLRTVYPGVRQAMAWQAETVSRDPLGLWTPATVADDAFLKDCRQTGQHVWGLIGLLSAIKLAKAMGDADDIARFEAQYASFRAAFDQLLDRQTAQTGGYIPPALERTTAGNDWDNLHTLHPELLYAPDDPRVEATLRTVRARYQEGLLAYTWPAAAQREGDEFLYNEEPGIHYWQTPNSAQASLVRGTAWDQEWAVRELYAMLLHSTSTHLPAEFGTIPWSTREYSHVFNILPQCTSSAKTVQLLRNMLVREQEGDLHLLSALSPEWVQPGQTIAVTDEPSEFGPVSLTVGAATDCLTVALPTIFRNAPARLLVRVPWCWELERAEVDGVAVAASDGLVAVPEGGRTLRLVGRLSLTAPALSFAQAVADYKAEYRRRYEHFLRTGSRHPDETDASPQ